MSSPAHLLHHWPDLPLQRGPQLGPAGQVAAAAEDDGLRAQVYSQVLNKCKMYRITVYRSTCVHCTVSRSDPHCSGHSPWWRTAERRPTGLGTGPPPSTWTWRLPASSHRQSSTPTTSGTSPAAWAAWWDSSSAGPSSPSSSYCTRQWRRSWASSARQEKKISLFEYNVNIKLEWKNLYLLLRNYILDQAIRPSLEASHLSANLSTNLL